MMNTLLYMDVRDPAVIHEEVGAGLRALCPT